MFVVVSVLFVLEEFGSPTLAGLADATTGGGRDTIPRKPSMEQPQYSRTKGDARDHQQRPDRGRLEGEGRERRAGASPEFVRRVRSHFRLDDAEGPVDEGSSGYHQGDEDRDEGDAGAQTSGAAATGTTETGESGRGGLEREGAEPEQGASGPRGDGDLGDGDELTVQRSEEELRAGVREREAGKLNVKKRVRTERERIAVPKKREEVTVERVAVDEEAPEGQIGEDEVSMRVVEEEVVVDKRAVVKEELRIKKDVVEEEEIVEEDVRKEEIDVDDSSGTVGDR